MYILRWSKDVVMFDEVYNGSYEMTHYDLIIESNVVICPTMVTSTCLKMTWYLQMFDFTIQKVRKFYLNGMSNTFFGTNGFNFDSHNN